MKFANLEFSIRSFQAFLASKMKLLGDSRARHFGDMKCLMKPDDSTYHSIGGLTTRALLESSNWRSTLTGEEDIVVVFALQCDLTAKRGDFIDINQNIDIKSLCNDLIDINRVIQDKCPNAYIYNALPINHRFDKLNARFRNRAQDKVARVERKIYKRLKSKLYIFDLSLANIILEPRIS